MTRNTAMKIKVEGKDRLRVLDIIEEELVKCDYKILIRDNIHCILTIKDNIDNKEN